MLTALKIIPEQQSNLTQDTESAVTQFLDYAATNMSAIVKYKSRDLILHINSDASYLSEPQARRCTGGHYYLISLPTNL